MQTLTYVIGKDRRALVDNVQNFTIDFNDAGIKNWVQARQYEDTMRQIFVNVQNEDGTPFDLTNVNPVFEGRLPGGKYAVLDSKHGVVLDPLNGQFRFDMPARAFAIAGSYQQAFFRLYKDGQNITTLEFNLEVLADKVISGIIPSDYITPFEDLYSKLEAILKNAGTDLEKFKEDWNTKIAEAFKQWTDGYNNIQEVVARLQSRINDIAAEVKANDVVTVPMLARFAGEPVLIGVAHFTPGKDLQGYDELFPDVHMYVGKYGAGIGGAGEQGAGGSEVYEVNVRPVFMRPGEVQIWVSPDNIHQYMQDLDMADPDQSNGGRFAYVYSGIFTISIELKNALVTSFDVASDFVANFKDTQPTANKGN